MLFFLWQHPDTINKSKKILKLLLKYDIPIFFIKTHCFENINIEKSNFYQGITSFIVNNFSKEEADKILIHRGQNEIYNIIRINQKKDQEHQNIFGVDILIEKILHFFFLKK